ncbi:SAM-dependent methyltransferase [Saccharopolyspora cebuensis]|uniref:SAM-dependent methyltransferase n=1 Tax=Saccharopolyspora cebuensis TaxID=418759 RepID=A0ABV4CIP2_9PSEU
MERSDFDSPDVNSPNAARMYDYFLGGAANFAVDRIAAEQALAVTPEIGRFARANRSFLGRLVAHLCDLGIDQFLDLGSGVPTVGNVHQIAHRHDPHARVAYVDVEPVAVSHARSLLDGQPHVTITQADIRSPEAVLSAPGVAGLMDFTRPVAVLAVAILHFVPDDDDPASLVASYHRACAPGSYLGMSHASPVTMTAEQVAGGREVYRSTTTPITPRSREAIMAMLTGWQLLDPGLVPLDQWRPDTTGEPVANGYGALAYLP